MTTLGKVCKFQYGASLPERSREPGLVEVYGSNGIVGQHSIALTDGPAIVIGRKGSIGQVHFSPQACWPIDTTYYVDRQNTQADLYWLSFILKSLRLDKLNKAAAVPGLNRTDAYQLPIPLPPLAEQRRIAAAIEERLCEVERARAAVQAQLDDAHALMAAHLRAVFESEEAQGWTKTVLGTHATKIGSGQTPTGGHAVYQKEGIPLIRSQNVRMNKFDATGLAYISADIDKQMAATRVQKGDVLLNITGASIGRVCVVPDHVCPANVNQHVSIIRVSNAFLPQFLSFYLSSPAFQRSILEQQAGATRQALTKTMIERFSVPMIPRERQQQIVNMLLEAEFTSSQGYAAFESQLELIDRLPAAILRQAFAGEL